jgi:hypothetical protein
MYIQSITTELISTLIIFVGSLFLYKVVDIFLKKQQHSAEKQHRILVNTRNVLTFIFITGCFFVWIGEVKTSILSAAAICSALIITFKEMILSFFGAILSNKNFQLGDHIEIEGQTGEIINKTFLSTTILLNDTYQTQELMIPNINFLSSKIKKLSKIPKVQFFEFSIAVEKQNEILKEAETLKEIFFDVIAFHNPNYHLYLEKIAESIPYFDNPKNLIDISYDISDPKRYLITLHILCKSSQMTTIKNDIIQRYLRTKSGVIALN